MKQKIYILGLITTLIIFFGTMFKVEHWPGAGYMIAIGMIVLVIVFLPVALRNNYRTEGTRQNLVIYTVTWLTCFIVFTGMLFKIQHWPHAGFFLMLALPFPYVVFLPVYLIVTAKNKNQDVNNTVFVFFLLGVISVFSVLLALTVSKERIDESLSLSRSYNNVESVLNSVPVTDNNIPVIRKIDEVLKIVDDYQNLIFLHEGITEEQWNKDPTIIRMAESPQVQSAALLVVTNEGTKLDTRLETGLHGLMQEFQNTPGYEELAKSAPGIFEFTEPFDGQYDWTSKIFQYSTRSWVLIYLNALETNLKLLKNCLP